MAYIYIIKNDINNKVYVGKTQQTVKDRFKEHIRESRRKRCEKRPLYSAMNKYGFEHFQIEVLEKCKQEEASEKEIFWIKKYNSYKYGYSATKGGDGKPYTNRKKIIFLYISSNKSLNFIAKQCQCSPDTVRNILYEEGYTSKEILSRTKYIQQKTFGKSVLCVEKQKIFSSLWDAGRWILNTYNYKNLSSIRSHIQEVCNGKRHMAYGYRWQFVETDNNTEEKVVKKIRCIETNNVFSSLKAASRWCGNEKAAPRISKICRKIPGYKTAYGYHWEFVEN